MGSPWPSSLNGKCVNELCRPSERERALMMVDGLVDVFLAGDTSRIFICLCGVYDAMHFDDYDDNVMWLWLLIWLWPANEYIQQAAQRFYSINMPIYVAGEAESFTRILRTYNIMLWFYVYWVCACRDLCDRCQ